MNVNKEFELKMSIDEEGYQKINQYFPLEKKQVDQINYYFDTKCYSLSRNKVTLRIRLESGIYEICLKVKKSSSKDVVVKSDEYNFVIKENSFLDIVRKPENIQNFLSNKSKKILKSIVGSRPIKFLGSIQNLRKFLKGIKGYTFELDMSKFPNGLITYEIEIENFSLQNLDELLEKLNSLEVNAKTIQSSKYKTFIEIHRSSNK